MTAFAVSALYPGPEGPGFTARVDKKIHPKTGTTTNLNRAIHPHPNFEVLDGEFRAFR